MHNKKQLGSLPSINALRSFETTARLGSVTKAAGELCVTPSAVSHQIHNLEERFGRTLIRFAGGEATLTAWGSMLLPGLMDGFARIHNAVYLLQNQPQTQTLTIAARPLFASKWLSPRLDRFWELHPNIALRMRYMTQKIMESSDGATDISIEWYAQRPHHVNCTQLFPAALTPVCSASLNIDTHTRSLQENLNSFVLLREGYHDPWRDWLQQMNIPDFQPEHTAFLDDGSIRLNAAIAGKGIDLSVPCFLKQEFAAGLLIEPFPDAMLRGHYYLVLQKYPSTKAIAFQTWVLEEVANDPVLQSQGVD